jgi:tRNA nucleotidyltransferase (CCA-adding enzyme)
MTTTTTPIIKHSDIVRFADDRVNLKREKASEYRGQVNRLREKLAAFVKDHPDVGVRKLLLSGSLAKGTALSQINDIDVALYVEAGKAPSIYDNRKELLEWVAEKLRQAYPQMSADQITVQTHTVKVSFSGSGLDVEVAPVWWDAALDPNQQDNGQLLNRHTGELVLTSIPMHIEFVRRRKRKQETHYAQVVRLVKWWVRQQKAADSQFRCRSFLAEMLCAKVADDGADFSNYPDALSSIFRFLLQGGLERRIVFTDYYKASDIPADSTGPIEVFDPVNPDNNVVSDYSAADRDRIVEAAQIAFDAIDEAEWAQTKARATECWQRVLGPSFKP